MVKKRREFLLSSAALIFYCQNIRAYPITKLLGNPNREFTQSYINRYLKWYQTTWAPLISKMSSLETKLFLTWKQQTSSFGQEIAPGFFVENFLTRHHLSAKEKTHSCYYAGCPSWSNELNNHFTSFIQSILNPKDFEQYKDMEFYGWSSDFDKKSHKIFVKKMSSNPLFKELPVAPLGFIEIKDQTIIRRATIQPVKDYPPNAHPQIDKHTIIQALKTVDQDKNITWKLRTKSTYLLPLKTGTMTVAGLHKKEFNQIPDFLDVSKDDEIKIYYP